MKKYKRNNGITLIALVITIIVMIILVAVVISMAVNGKLFDYAEKATKDTELAKQEELKLASGYFQGLPYGAYLNTSSYVYSGCYGKIRPVVYLKPDVKVTYDAENIAYTINGT